MDDKYAEEMREMLKEMVEYPSDVFDFGCSSFGEAAEWALETIDTQKAKIKHIEKERKWKSIYKCPPPLYTKVLVATESGEMVVAWKSALGMWSPASVNSVTHWMELPDFPPEEN